MYERTSEEGEAARDPLAIIAAMETLMDELGEAIAARDGAQPARTLPAAVRCAQRATTLKVVLSQLTSTPYIEVAKRRILDGEQGPVIPISNKRHFLPGATAKVLAYLLQHSRADEIELVALQITKDHGTVASRRRNAQTTVSNLNKSIAGIGIRATKLEDCHNAEYVLTKSPDCSAIFSVDIAAEIARRADRSLEEKRFALAADEALNAIRVDGEVQTAHEVLCRASLMIGSDRFEEVEQLRSSVERLQNRISRLGLCTKLIERWLKQLGKQERADELKAVQGRMQKEIDRLAPMIGDVSASFGALLSDLSPKDIEANVLLVTLRAKSLSVEQALGCAEGQKLLKNERIATLHQRANARMPKNTTAADRTALARMVHTVFMQRALNPDASVDIRCVCTSVDYAIRRLQGDCSERRPTEARLMCELTQARNAYFSRHGRNPDLEELTEATGLTAARIEEIDAWEAIARPAGGDAIARYCRSEDCDPDENEDARPRRNGLHQATDDSA